MLGMAEEAVEVVSSPVAVLVMLTLADEEVVLSSSLSVLVVSASAVVLAVSSPFDVAASAVVGVAASVGVSPSWARAAVEKRERAAKEPSRSDRFRERCVGRIVMLCSRELCVVDTGQKKSDRYKMFGLEEHGSTWAVAE